MLNTDAPVPSSTGRRRPTGRTSRLLRRIPHAPFVALGLAGQGFTLAAMLLPILLGRADQVLVLVFASAVSALLLNAALLAYPFVYPVLRGPRSARLATASSLVSLGTVSVAVTALSPLEGWLNVPPGTFLASALLTATMGLYTVVSVRLVRVGDTTGIGLLRFSYGALVLVGTAVAAASELGAVALTHATSLAFLAATVLLLPRQSHRGPRLQPSPRAARRRIRRAYLRRAVRPTVASLAGGYTGLVPGLMLPGLGTAAEPWAVVARICGGFMTFMMTLLEPPLEARLSRAVRERDRPSFRAARRTALLSGMLLAVVAVASALGLAVYVSDDVEAWFWPVAVGTTLFWGSLLAITLVNRLPNFLGRDSARLAWDTGRAVLLTIVLVTVEGVVQAVVMGVVLAVSSVILLPMTRWAQTDQAGAANDR